MRDLGRDLCWNYRKLSLLSSLNPENILTTFGSSGRFEYWPMERQHLETACSSRKPRILIAAKECAINRITDLQPPAPAVIAGHACPHHIDSCIRGLSSERTGEFIAVGYSTVIRPGDANLWIGRDRIGTCRDTNSHDEVEISPSYFGQRRETNDRPRIHLHHKRTTELI